jgi:predicted acetyltransferase
MVRFRRMRTQDPLWWALREPRVVRTTGTADMLWLRVLDVVAALEARPWYADGEVVLEVEDPLGHAAGRWRVAAGDGAARVTATEDEPEVRLSADALGSLYLGGVEVPTLHAAGRLPGSAEGVRRLAALADGGPEPYCSTGF